MRDLQDRGFWDGVLSVVGDIVLFVVILAIGFVLSWVIGRLVEFFLGKVHFEKLVTRSGINRYLSSGKYSASQILAKVVYYALLLVTLQYAFRVWGNNPVSDLLNDIVSFIPQLFVALVLVVVAFAVASVVKDLILSALSSRNYGRWTAQGAYIFIVALGIIAALNQVGIATTVTMPILIAVLATVSGILIVGAGGGLIKPMQSRWERILDAGEKSASSSRSVDSRDNSVNDSNSNTTVL